MLAKWSLLLSSSLSSVLHEDQSMVEVRQGHYRGSKPAESIQRDKPNYFLVLVMLLSVLLRVKPRISSISQLHLLLLLLLTYLQSPETQVGEHEESVDLPQLATRRCTTGPNEDCLKSHLHDQQ